MAFQVLWVDDKIDELRSHVVYLGERGYAIEGVTNGRDALALLQQRPFDAILLDEMMPGLGGLETLEEIKKINEHVPVIMITKSEAEDLMSRAIGKRIDDYLVKPVSPLQILSALKRQLEARRLTGEQVTRDYLSHFADVDRRIEAAATPDDWVQVYVDMVTWGMDLFQFSDRGLLETQAEQMVKANLALARYVRDRYEAWVGGADDAPLMSPGVYQAWVEPEVRARGQVIWIVIDCMRLDQWRMVEPLLEPYYHIDRRYYWSILPSATPYARNALFAGLFPLDIARNHSQWWKSGHDEGSRNAHEDELLGAQLERLDSAAAGSYKYYKISDARETDPLRRQLGSLADLKLIVSVYNFLDIMAHGRSQSSILKELAPDEAAFRSLMRSWFEHSSLFEILKQAAQRGATVVLTTDHGSMFCNRATQIRANRDTSTNVRYKYGDNLTVDEKKVFLLKDPERFQLPANTAIENYAITQENYYLVYPTKFHEYERLYRDSFQHGGISLQELICPLLVMQPR